MRKDLEYITAIENANHHMLGLTNVTFHIDEKNSYVASQSYATKSILKFHCVKSCVIMDPFMVIAEYVLGNGSVTDDALVQRSEIGRCVYAGDYASLGWPRTMRWRHDSHLPRDQVGMLPEASLAVYHDRKSSCASNMMLRPFNPSFDRAEGIALIEAAQRTVNERFQIGHSLCERFFGIIVQVFPWMGMTRKETNLQFVNNSIEIIYLAWNLIKMSEDRMYLTEFTQRQREYHSESYIYHYIVDPKSRIRTDENGEGTQQVQTTPPLVQETSALLCRLWTYYAPRAEPLLGTGAQFHAPLVPISLDFHDKEIPEFYGDRIVGAEIVDCEEEGDK